MSDLENLGTFPTWEEAVVAALDDARESGGIVHVHAEYCESGQFEAPNTPREIRLDRGELAGCTCEPLTLDPEVIVTTDQVRRLLDRGVTRFVQ